MDRSVARNAAGQSLATRRVVVTGAGRGIGRAIAESLAKQGADVVLAARTLEQVESVASEIREGGGRANALRCDITDDASVSSLVAQSESLLGGPVDTLINNAGVYASAGFAETDLDTWRWMMDTNVLATVRVTQGFLPQLLSHASSRLVTVASIAGLKGTAGQTAYNASKHAQIGLTRSLALEYGRQGLRTNAVCPGFILTDLIDLDAVGRTNGVSGDEMLEKMQNATAIGRTVTVEEVAATVAYLVSPAADGINGQSLAVDGGIVY